MTGPKAVIAALALCAGALPASAQTVSFGSPMVLGGGNPRDAGNVTCYFSNVGNRTVRLESVELINVIRGAVVPSTNVCGALSGFDLAPGQTCFIGATVRFQPNGYACRARVLADDGKQIRGSIEARSQGQIVFESLSLTVGPNAGSPETFRPIASPPLFGSPTQNFARCSLTNLGSVDAKLKQVRFVRSDGTVAPTTYNDCAAAGEFTLAPGATCEAGMSFTAGQATDIQCRAMTTRRADIRGMLRVSDPDDLRNSRPLE